VILTNRKRNFYLTKLTLYIECEELFLYIFSMSERLVRPQQTPMVFLGAGAISAVGRTAQETHQALITQQSGIRLATPDDITQLKQIEKITGKSASEVFEGLYKSGVMALIEYPLMNVDGADDRFIQLAQMAIHEALEQS
jgi:3-oxoacyl-(acyl-carrier-protein) synthase